MAPHSSTLAWRIPGMVEPGGLQSMASQKCWTWLSNLTTTLALSGKTLVNVVPPYKVVNITRGCVLPGKSVISELSFSMVQFSSVQSLSHLRLFVTPWIAARQASLSITISQSSLKLMSIELVMPSSHLILIVTYHFLREKKQTPSLDSHSDCVKDQLLPIPVSHSWGEGVGRTYRPLTLEKTNTCLHKAGVFWSERIWNLDPSPGPLAH